MSKDKLPLLSICFSYSETVIVFLLVFNTGLNFSRAGTLQAEISTMPGI